jgi:transcriptional regulator with XRE-family HTH domain
MARTRTKNRIARGFDVSWAPMRDKRQQMGISQHALANAVGCHLMTINRMELGHLRHGPEYGLVVAIARALGVAEWDLRRIENTR